MNLEYAFKYFYPNSGSHRSLPLSGLTAILSCTNRIASKFISCSLNLVNIQADPLPSTTGI